WLLAKARAGGHAGLGGVADKERTLQPRLILAAGGKEQANQRFGRFGVMGRALDPGADVGEQLVGGEVAGDKLGADLVEPASRILAGGDAPGVEIVAIGEVEFAHEQAAGS